MKLTVADKEYLKEVGYLDEDMAQIEEATRKTDYELSNGEKVSAAKALELLGREKYLTGVARSAFHWSAAREIENSGMTILFDSSRLFKTSARKKSLDSQINNAETKVSVGNYNKNSPSHEASL